ncbi:MAG: right-handed parallel beta-helix repeat-containing protein [Candidatus Heimdallarchaeaceae archaeon]|jgi:hypothetical protein
MKRSTKALLIVIPTIVVGYFMLKLLVVYYMSPSFGRPRIKNLIQIYSDEDFEELNIPGVGTQSNPYLIEDMIFGINSTGVRNWYYGLDVANTTKHFIVQNCTFFGGLNAIRINNIEENSAFIKDNHFYVIWQSVWDSPEGNGGIEIRNTNRVTIENNSFEKYSNVDFYYILTIYNSHNIIFENNSCEEGWLDIEKSSEILVIGNLFEEFWYWEDLHYLNFTNNVFKGTYWYLEFLNCTYSIFNGNTFHQRVDLRRSSFTVFINNKIDKMNDSSGLIIDDSSYVDISNNTLIYTGEIYTYGTGIALTRGSSNCTIQLNEIYNFPYNGLWINEDSNFNTIFHNSFFDNFITNSSSQAYDEGDGNIWYNSYILEGNYWSNLGLNITYVIDGSAGAEDLYPLSSPLV